MWIFTEESDKEWEFSKDSLYPIFSTLQSSILKGENLRLIYC